MTVEEWARTRYFKPREFDSKDVPGSGFAGMQFAFVSRLDTLRTQWGLPLTISSGFRTAAHNEKVGGKPNSAHLRGYAADVATVSLERAIAFAVLAAQNGFRRIGVHLGGRYVHIDCDPSLPTPATWFYGTDA